MITPTDRAVLALFADRPLTIAQVRAGAVCSDTYAHKALRHLTAGGYLTLQRRQRDPALWTRTAKIPPPIASERPPAECLPERVILRGTPPPPLDIILQRARY